MGELLKNIRVVGGAVGAIGLAVALGIYQPDESGAAALVAVVGACGGAALGAVGATIARRLGGGKKDGAAS